MSARTILLLLSASICWFSASFAQDASSTTYQLKSSAVSSVVSVNNLSTTYKLRSVAPAAPAQGATQPASTTYGIRVGFLPQLDITATKLAFSTQPAGSVSSEALMTQPLVQAQDAEGNVDLDFQETITLTESAAGFLTNNVITALNGVATFVNLIYTASGGSEDFALIANDQDGVGTDLPTATSSTVMSNVTASKLAFTNQPSGVVHLSPFTIGVAAQDAAGNTDVGFTGTVTLELSPSGSLSSTTVSFVNGVAVFTDLTVSGAGSGRTIMATTVSGLTPATSSSFSVAQATAIIALNNLTASYDGTAKAGGATTTPAGLSVGFSYTKDLLPLGGPPSAPGVYGLTATISDANYSGNTVGTLTINDPPAPVVTLSASATQGNPPFGVTFTIQVTGYSYAAFLETNTDGGAISDNTYGAGISFTKSVAVTYSTPGSHEALLTVRGPKSLGEHVVQVSQSITVNSVPQVDVIAAATELEDRVLELDLMGKDPQAGTWSVSDTDVILISGVAVVGDMIQFTPVTNASGNDAVTITRTNVYGLSTEQSVNLTWTAVDDPPEITALAGNFEADEDIGLQVAGAGNAADVDTDVGTLVWSASGFDAGLVGAAAGGSAGIDFTPVANAHGFTAATIHLTDPSTGNEATQAVILTWNPINDPPSVPVANFPANGATEVTLSPLLSWSAVDVDGESLVYDVSLGPAGAESSVAGGTSATTYSAMDLDPGVGYGWSVTARDPAGATAAASFGFTTEQDLRPPVLSNVRAAVTHDMLTLSWSTDEPGNTAVHAAEDAPPAKVVATQQQTVFDVVEGAFVTEHSVTLEGLSSATWYDYELRSTDEAGNTSDPVSGQALTLAAPDEDPPQFLVSPYVEGITEQSAVVRWRTDELSDSRVRWQPQGVAKVVETQQTGGEIIDPGLLEDHAVGLSGLSVDTDYRIEVESHDAVGNPSVVEVGFFTTEAEADQVEPGFVHGPAALSVTEASAQIEFGTDEPTNAQVRFDTDIDLGDGRLAAGTQPSGSHQITLAGLLAETTYHYRVFIQDGSGNETISDARSFDTRAGPDLQAASFLIGPAIEGLTEQSGILVLGADEPVRLQVLLSTSANLDNPVLRESATLQADHSVSLTNLEPDTPYFYEVVARDGAGNETPAVRGEFSTLAEQDLTPPQLVKGPYAEGIGATGATIVYCTNELTIGSLSYATFGNAKINSLAEGGILFQITPSTEHRVSLTQLAPDTTYDLFVLAQDAQGNSSDAGVGSFTTLRMEDLDLPQVVTGPVAQGITVSGATIEVSYDEPVELTLRYSVNPDLTGAEVRPVSTRRQDHREGLSGLEAGTTYHAGLVARDAAGNATSEITFSFVTETDADVAAPVFTVLPYTSDVQIDRARVLWSLDEPADGEVILSMNSDLSAASWPCAI